MKSALAIILALLVLLQSGSGACRVLGYQLNRTYITRVLCINRDKPQLKCHGKCYLRKQLKQDGGEQQKHQREQETGSMPLFCQPIEPWQPAVIDRSSPVRFPPLRQPRLNSPSFAVFSPPWDELKV